MRNPEKKTPPKPPQRVSSLERKENRESIITVIHVNGSTSSREDVGAEVPEKTSSQDGDSKSSRDGDSGRETSSSPTEPTSPRQPSLPSPEMECSESDLEADRQEILRVKTTINSSRIPSMCVITPPQSDDESFRSGSNPISRESSGSQIDNHGQQAPPQGLLGSLVSQGQSHGVTAKMLAFQNSGAKSVGLRSVGAISSVKSASMDDSGSEKDSKDSGGKVPLGSHGYTPTLTVIPRGKDGDINAHLKGIMHTAAVSAPTQPDPDQPVLIRPSLVKQAEREKRLSQESDDSHPEIHRQTSKEEKQKPQGEKGPILSSDLISYKELPPPTTTAAHPFSAVPSSVKQNVVITPTNSLERRKANPAKAGARVTLNSDGKVVYSSDSLPRRKGHSSFEPGPYVKPQVTTNSSQSQAVGGNVSSSVPSTANIKPSSVSAPSSSIQQTPLPPPPITTTANSEPSPQPHPMAKRPQQPLPHSVTHQAPLTTSIPHSKNVFPVASQSTHSSSSMTTTASVPTSTQKPLTTTTQHQPLSGSNSAPSSHQQTTTLLSKLNSTSSQQSHLPLSSQSHLVHPTVSHSVSLPQTQSVQPHSNLASQPHSALSAQHSLPPSTTPHHPSLASQHHPTPTPAQPQTVLLSSQAHQPSSQGHPPPPIQTSSHPSLPSQPHAVSTQSHPTLSHPHSVVTSHPQPVQATQPPPTVQSSQSQLPSSSQLLSSTSAQAALLSSKQTVSPHISAKAQPKSDSLTSHQSHTPSPSSSSSVPIQTSVTRTPKPLPQQRLQQAAAQPPPQSPNNQKQASVFAAKGDDDAQPPDKQISSVSGSSNSIYGITQQQQLRQQQQQILQARQEAQMQLLQQQQQQIYQTRQETQRAIQQQQLQQLQQQQLQQQQLQQQQLQQHQLQKQHLQQLQQQQLQQHQLQQQYLYQTKEETQAQLQQQQMILQQPLYQTHQELQQARHNIVTSSQPQTQQLTQPVTTAGNVIMASQGAPMSPRSQRAGAYVHVQGQVSSGTAPQQMVPSAQISQGSQSGSKSGTTSRAPTPVQGPMTSSPHRGAQHSTEAFTQLHLRTDPGMLYGSQRSLQSVGLLPEGRGVGGSQQPARPISTSPPPYLDHQHSLTDSDIYGRIGMTRHVQVGGTLPAGFGRHQRGYNSLPPSRRQSYVPQTVEEQQLLLQQQQQQLARRSSVASYTAGANIRDGQRPAASNPSTPEKVLDKKEKSSKKEKDKDKKKKEAKTEKSPKKKWFWTLPLRRKKKNKEESTEEDDGGFKAASEKGARKLLPRDDSSFIRYPSPDTASSDMNSSYSSEMSGDHSYRSSPSSEVYYYSQRAQQQTIHLHHQQQQQQQLQQQQQKQQQQQQQPQQQQQQQQQQAGGLGPRSLPTTPVSPPDNSQGSFVTVNSVSQSVMSDVTDLTVTDLSRGRRYMSREELYAAMRHPQYYHRGAIVTQASDYTGQKSTPTPSRSTSPAVFGVNPLPPYTVRPQAHNLYSGWPPDQQQIGASLKDHNNSPHLLTESHSEDTSPTTDVEPPEAYQDLSTSEGLSLIESQGRLSPRKPPCGQESPQNQQNQQSQQNQQQTLHGNQSTPKQTSRGDFKKMILNKSMSSAGGNHRISAVEMLRASRPGIYGYSPPPAPVVKPPQPSPTPSRGEGVIIPPSSRNTARALLFQSRFGSGRRYRTPKTEIISTTILEDHGGEVVEQEDDDDDDDDDDEDEEDSESDSPDHSSLQNVRGPLARAYSEPCSSSNTKATTSSPSTSPVDEVAHSTPNTTLEPLPHPPDVSIITPDPVSELLPSDKDKESDEKESMETAL